jgi:CheY-like chemotaxis protein
LPRTAVIAIVDDDQSVREALTSLVRSLGYGAIAFECAEDLLNSKRRRRVSCLIADVQMPGMTGPELHHRLVSSGEPIPTVLITAFPDARARERALQAGVISLSHQAVRRRRPPRLHPFDSQATSSRWEGLSTSLTFAYLKNRLRISRRLRRVRIPGQSCCRTPSISAPWSPRRNCAFCRRNRRRTGDRSHLPQRKESSGLPIASAVHAPKLVAFFVYTSPGPSHVRRIFSSAVAPTMLSPGENRMQSIVGTWKLLHATTRDAAGAARPLSYGGRALGRLTLTADGRMMSVVCDGGTELPADVGREYSRDALKRGGEGEQRAADDE